MLMEKVNHISRLENLMHKSYVINGLHCLCYVDSAYSHEQFSYIEHYLHEEINHEAMFGSRTFISHINPELYSQIIEMAKWDSPPIETSKEKFHILLQDQETYFYLPVLNGSIIKHEPIVAIKKEEVLLIFHHFDSGYPRFMLRAIRDTYVRKNEDLGAVMFHASGVGIDFDNQKVGIMVVGKKGAGKTTLMFHMLNGFENVGFLANDRLLISTDHQLLYLPLCIRATYQSLKNTSHEDVIKNTHNWSRSSLPVEFINLHKEEKYELTPLEIKNIFGNRLLSTAPLNYIILTHFDLSLGDQVMLRSPQKPQLLSLLHESCFTPFDERWYSLWMTQREKSDSLLSRQSEECIIGIANSIPIYEILFGPKATTFDICQSLKQIFTPSIIAR